MFAYQIEVVQNVGDHIEQGANIVTPSSFIIIELVKRVDYFVTNELLCSLLYIDMNPINDVLAGT